MRCDYDAAADIFFIEMTGKEGGELERALTHQTAFGEMYRSQAVEELFVELQKADTRPEEVWKAKKIRQLDRKEAEEHYGEKPER